MFEAPDKICYRDSEFPPHLPGIPDNIYETILTALQNGRVLDISYQDFENKESCRKILPEVLLESSGKWYIGAYCYLREEERSFRIDRIRSVEMLSLRDKPRGIADLYRESENPPLLEPDENWKQKLRDLELCRHAERGEIEKMQQDIAAGANVNAQRSNSNPPLHSAAAAGQLEAVKFLLTQGADPDLKNPHEEKALFVAVWFRRTEVIRFLIEECHCSPNDKNIFGWAALFAAINNSDLQTAQYLLEHGADITSVDKRGESLLIKTVNAVCGGTTERIMLIKLLLKYGADIRTPDKKGQNILFHATRNYQVKLLQYLIKTAPDLLKEQDKEGKNILLAALERFSESWRFLEPTKVRDSHREIISTLCSSGADVNFRDRSGRTPLMVTPECFFDLLLEQGADPCAADIHGKTVAVYQAASPQNVQTLFAAGADIMAKDNSGTGVLMAALPEVDHIRHYIETYGFSVNDRNQTETILHRSANAIKPETVLYLLEHGANISAVNSEGRTAFEEYVLRHPYACEGDPRCDDTAVYNILQNAKENGVL